MAKRLVSKHSPSTTMTKNSYGSIRSASDRPNNDDANENANTTTVHNYGGATMASAIINLSNTIIGAGMLGLPGAFGGTGYFTGMILIVASAACAAHGLVLLTKVAGLTGRPCSFYSVAHASIPRYTAFIDAVVALNCFGVATGYFVTISFSMVKVFEQVLLSGDTTKDEPILISLLLSRRTWVIGALISVLPFSFYRTLDDLKKSSAMASIFVFTLVCMIIAYANGIADPCMDENENEEEQNCKGDVTPYTNFALTFSRLPVFVFAFTCHQNIFPIVNEMKVASQKRLNIVICASIGFALVLYATVAFEGYQTYGSLVHGDILLNYPENWPVTFLRLCIALMLTLHYPLQLDPSRRCLTSLVKVIMQRWDYNKEPRAHANDGDLVLNNELHREDSVETLESELVGDEFSHFETSSERRIQQKDINDDERLFYIITISFLSLSFVLASIIDDLGFILALVGATGSTLVSFVLPGLIYIKLHPTKDFTFLMAYVQLSIGIVLIPISLYLIVIERSRN